MILLMRLKIILPVVLFITLFFLSVLTNNSFASSKRTTTLWTSSSNDGAFATPYVRSDKKALFIDFEEFNGVEYVYYNLNYTNRDNGVRGGVEGSFIPRKEVYSGNFNGKPYVRYEIPFGSCSGKRCVLHRAKDVKLTVNTKMKNGKHYSKIINIPQDQF